VLTWPPDRDRPGLHHHLAERAVEPVLRAGAIGDVGDAADHVAGEGARGLALRGGAVGVGDVVAREVRIGDRRGRLNWWKLYLNVSPDAMVYVPGDDVSWARLAEASHSPIVFRRRKYIFAPISDPPTAIRSCLLIITLDCKSPR